MNRLGNTNNRFQGDYRRVLCVCSAGLLRSPTAALVLSSDPYNFNTRAAGLNKEYALIPVDMVLLTWAHEIVCMEDHQAESIRAMLDPLSPRRIVSLDIPDSFEYRDEGLMAMIRQRYDQRAAA